MTSSYTVALRNPGGYDVAIWDDYIQLDYSRQLNQAGRLTITMPVRIGMDPRTIQRDYHLLVYRKPTNAAQYLDMRTWWIIDSIDWDIWNNTVQIEAGDLLHILKRRIVGYTPQTSYADKTYIQHGMDAGGADLGFFLKADDMIKEYVNENLNAAALDSVRDIEVLTIEADEGLGPDVEQQAAWRSILQVCQDIASQSAGLGTDLYFDIVPIGDRTFEFRTFTGVLGTDRTAESSSPTVFTDVHLNNPHLKWDYREEKTHIYSTAEGSGSGVLYLEQGDTSRDYSLWGRTEHYVNLGSITSDEDYMDRKMTEAIYDNRPKLTLNATIVDGPGSEYGKDYNYGDKVSVIVEGYTFDSVVDKVQVGISGGEEQITASVVGEVTI